METRSNLYNEYRKMTPFKVLFVAIFCTLFLSIQAQNTPQHVIKANVLGIGIGGFSLAYEHAFNEKVTGAVTGRFFFFDFRDNQAFTFGSLGTVDLEYKMNLALIGVLPEARFYVYSFFENAAPEGFFLSPYVGFTRTNVSVGSLSNNFIINGGTSITFLEFGGTIGYQFLIGERVTLDFFSGLGFTTLTVGNIDVEVISSTNSERINDIISFDRNLPFGATLTGVLPRFGASIGIAF